MMCGNCSHEVKSYLENLSEELYEGKSLFIFKEEIESELSDFEYHCPPNFEGIYFSVEKIIPGKVRIRAKRGDKKVKRDEIHQVLSNFMDRKLTQLFEISIILSE
jgi:predicted DNA-binding protein